MGANILNDILIIHLTLVAKCFVILERSDKRATKNISITAKVKTKQWGTIENIFEVVHSKVKVKT